MICNDFASKLNHYEIFIASHFVVVVNVEQCLLDAGLIVYCLVGVLCYQISNTYICQAFSKWASVFQI